MDVTGFGALNLDYVYEVNDLQVIRDAGFDLSPGHEISGSPEEAETLHSLCIAHGRLLAKSGGGSAANTIVILAALGHDTAFIGVAGDDPQGEFIIESMKKVDCSKVMRKGTSGQCIVIIESKTRDRAMFVVPASKASWEHSDISLSDTRILHMSSLAIEEGPSLQAELTEKLTSKQWLSFDPGELYTSRGMQVLAPLLERTNILFITQEELRMLDPLSAGYEVYQRLDHMHGPPLMVVKQGSKGAAAFIRGQEWFQPALSVEKVVDNTGAGDAFAAGFLHALLEKRSIPECLEEGARIAVKSLGGYGRRWLESINL